MRKRPSGSDIVLEAGEVGSNDACLKHLLRCAGGLMIRIKVSRHQLSICRDVKDPAPVATPARLGSGSGAYLNVWTGPGNG